MRTETESSGEEALLASQKKMGRLRKVISVDSVNASFVYCYECCVVVAWASLRASCLTKPLAAAGNRAVA